MGGVFIRVLMGLGLGLATIGVQAQSDNILSSWQFSTDIELENEVVQDSRSEVLFLENFLLVTHPNLDSENGCGEVFLLVENPAGKYIQVNTFSAQDFGRSCNAQDGFGFSVDYAGDLLVIGAPGQVFIEADGSLTRGAVYLYSLNRSLLFSAIQSIQPLARVAGTFEFRNVAWGTRVETDGERVLVQGNTKGDIDAAHGMAIAQTVNLLESDADNNWTIAQQFTDNASVYGHDFLIDEQTIIINNHAFSRFDSFINVPSTAMYNSDIEIYAANESNGLFEIEQTIAFENAFAAEPYFTTALQDVDQFFWQQDRLIVFSPQRGIFFRSSELTWYERDDQGRFMQAAVEPFLTDNIDIAETLNDVDGIAIFQSDRIGRGTLSAYELRQDSVQLNRRQMIAGQGNRSVENIDDLSLNSRNNRLLLETDQAGVRTLSIYSATPALDPAITGLWWFGQRFDGQGITLEVLMGNRLLLHWFTYDLSGNQMWVRGVGELVDGVVQMSLVRARGPRFPIGEFDPGDRIVDQWGTAEITFDSCRNGQLSYQSEEFGNDSLQIVPLIDNDFLCNRGFITKNANEIANGDVLLPGITTRFNGFHLDSVIGSSFDRSRSGEGIILMPATFDSEDNTSRDIVGLWLTYDQQGNQAWNYLGRSQSCFDGLCRWELIDTPRRPSGPVFGSAYNPDDRVIQSWGQFGPFFVVPRPAGQPAQLSVDFNNPDGSGTLILDKLTRPVGY